MKGSDNSAPVVSAFHFFMTVVDKSQGLRMLPGRLVLYAGDLKQKGN
jgi:hypothetical protein